MTVGKRSINSLATLESGGTLRLVIKDWGKSLPKPGDKIKKKLGAKLSHCTSLKLDTVASKLIPPAVKLKRSPIDRFIEAAISLSTDTDGGARSLNHHSPSTTKLFSGKASNHVRLASRSIIFCALTGSPDDEVTPSNRPRINGVKVMGCSNLSLKKELISAVS